MTIEIRGRVESFRRWMARALVAPTRRLLLVSRSADELILTMRLPPRPGAGAVELPAPRIGRERVSLRVVGRHLVVRGRRGWVRPGSGASRARSASAGLGEWLPRPFAATFALPFDTERSRIRTSVTDDTLEIRVSRRHESTPLA